MDLDRFEACHQHFARVSQRPSMQKLLVLEAATLKQLEQTA